MMNNKKVIKEEVIVLYGKEYTEITYEDGEVKLKIYDEEAKMWVYLSFAKEHNQEVIDSIIDTASRVLCPELYSK